MEKEDNTAVLLSVISAISDELDCCYLFMLFSAFLKYLFFTQQYVISVTLSS